MRDRRGKTTITDSHFSQSDEETKEAFLLAKDKLTRKSIRTSNQEHRKTVTRSQTTQKDLSSDGDDDDNDEELKQKYSSSPSKSSSTDDNHYEDDDSNNEDDALKQKNVIPQPSRFSRSDCKKAGMGNQKNQRNLFSDDDDDDDSKKYRISPTSKIASRDLKETEKRNPTNIVLSSDGKSWFSNKMKNIFCFFATLVIAAHLAAHYGLYDPLRNSANNHNVLTQFYNHFNALKSSYGSQSEHLWTRSRRSLELHLNRSESNTQPAIILLTAARDAERTLQCLSSQLARVYSASRNNSYMVISAANKTFHNSDSAKLAIDTILTSGFQDASSAAVLHQIESLHPGALLILYKYCDHENAAFKNVALVLTVLLKESKLEPQLSLTEIEEKVRDLLHEKMVSSKNTDSHSEMDADKLRGVWSRISHTVLPVYPEDTPRECGGIEQGL